MKIKQVISLIFVVISVCAIVIWAQLSFLIIRDLWLSK